MKWFWFSLFLLLSCGAINSSILFDNHKDELWFKASLKNGTIGNERDQTTKVVIIPLYSPEGKLTSMKLDFTIFLLESLFSDGLKISAVLTNRNANSRIDNSEFRTAPKMNSEYSFEQTIKARYFINHVGKENSWQYDTAFMTFSWRSNPNPTPTFSEFNLHEGMTIFIEAKEKTTIPMNFNITLREKVNPTIQKSIYLGILIIFTALQLSSAVIFCFKGVNKPIHFSRRLPMVPCLQAWAMDTIIFITCWTWFDAYYLIKIVHLTLSFISLPFLFNMMKNKDLFYGRDKSKNNKLLTGMGVILVIVNSSLMVMFTNKVVMVSMLILLAFILEGVVFNKSHKENWYFWMFMVPKSLTLFYIFYYPYNLLLSPVNYSQMKIVLLVGFILFIAILLQIYWNPRFGLKTSREKELMKLRPTLISSNKITEEEYRCPICWDEASVFEEDEDKEQQRAEINFGLNTSEDDLEEEDDSICSYTEVEDSKKQRKNSSFFKLTQILNKFSLKSSSKYLRTACGHTYHKECLRKWMDKSSNCPICRERIITTNSG